MTTIPNLGPWDTLAGLITVGIKAADAKAAAAQASANEALSRSGTSVAGIVPTKTALPSSPRDGEAYIVQDETAMYVRNNAGEWVGPIPIQGTATNAAVAAAVPSAPVKAALTGAVSSDIVAAGAGWEIAAGTALGNPTHATVQAAATRAASNGKRLHAAGTLTTSSTLFITSDADLSGLTINYTGTLTAVQVGTGTAGVLLYDKDIRLPRVIAANKNSTGWSSVAGTVGYRIVNTQGSKIWAPYAASFDTNMVLTGIGSGCVHNIVTIGHLHNGRTNLYLDKNTTGWTNQNVFVAGRLSHSSSEGLNVVGVTQIKMQAAGGNPMNANHFIGTSIEWGTAQWHLDVAGSYNKFDNVRFEVAGGARVRWQAGASNNVIQDGYQTRDVIVTTAAGAVNNQIRGADRWAQSSDRPVVFGNNGSAASPTLAVMDPTGIQDGVDPYTGYRWAVTANAIKGKRQADAFDRARLDGTNGRVYLGDGVAEPAYIGTAVGALRFEGFLTSQSAAVGAASALPATPAGYLLVYIDGAIRKMPYFN